MAQFLTPRKTFKEPNPINKLPFSRLSSNFFPFAVSKNKKNKKNNKKTEFQASPYTNKKE